MSLTTRRRAGAARLSAFVLGALCAASAVYGWLAWPQPYVLPPLAADDGLVTAARSDDAVARWLDGSTSTGAVKSDVSGRLVLVGVLGGSGSAGVALIAIDGQPAKAFKLGVNVIDGLVLRSAAGRQAVLGPVGGGEQNPVTLELKLPGS